MDQAENRHNLRITKNKSLLLALTFLLFWMSAIIFSMLASEIIKNKQPSVDVSILQGIHSHVTPMYDIFFLIVTTMGNAEILLPTVLLVVAYLLYKRRRLDALLVLFSVGGAAIASSILKLLFHRDRPSLWHSSITEMGYSFPSGHAMLSCALVLALVGISWNTRWRWSAISVGATTATLIGFSRLYMGVHYPTDILAGWCVSFMWVLIVFASLKGMSYRIHYKKEGESHIQSR
jgi:undecaprenyl-diphosphatase